MTSRIVRFFSFLFLCILAKISFATGADYVSFLSAGKAPEAIKLLEAKIASSSGEERINAIYQLGDVCLLTDDESCLDKVNKSYWNELDDYFKNSRGQDKNRRLALFDANLTYHYFWTIHFLDERHYDTVFKYDHTQFQVNAHSAHSGTHLLGKVIIASIKGKKEFAEENIRWARALVLNKDPSALLSQANLAYLLETSLYYLHDAKDVKRWYEANKAASSKIKKDVATHYNPYAYARLLQVVYHAGFLSGEKEIQLIEELHKVYSNLEINKDSRLHRKKEAFYAYLALDALWHDKKLSFDPQKVLNGMDVKSFEATGIKAYLDLEAGKVRIDSFAERLKDLEKIHQQVGPALKTHLAATRSMLHSLQARHEKDEAQETAYLEKFVEEQLTFFRNQSFGVGDNNPVLTKPVLITNRYVLERLKTLKPRSKQIPSLGLLVIQSVNSSLYGEEQASYAILNSAKNVQEEQQALNYVTMKERYANLTSHAYRDSAIAMAGNKYPYPAEKQLDILDSFAKNKVQLDEIKKRKNTGFVLDAAEIQALLKPGEIALFSGNLSNETTAVLTLTKSSSHFEIADIPKSGIVTLQSRSLAKLSPEKIKEASIQVSKAILAGLNNQSINKIYLLTGQTIGNIPYPLLSHPQSNKWLIQDVNLVSFSSSAQFFTKDHPAEKREPKYSLVAFGNPRLRDPSELKAVEETELMIKMRGARGGKVTALPELSETEDEILNFARNVEGHQLIYVGENAAIKNLLGINLNDVEVLLFATHGVMAGEVEGAYSPSIVLTPTADNGLVSSETLFLMKGAPGVVILSTCNSRTASTPLDQSEINSLASAFLLKGTKLVIASYWEVESHDTAELMSAFGKYIAKGFSYNEALQKAQNQLIESHPSSWAAFVSSGNYQSNRTHPKKR